MKIRVKVKPNARRGESIKKIIDPQNSEEIWEISVRQPAVEGKANLAVREILSRELKVAKTKIHLKKGSKSKIKIFEIDKTK